MREKLVKEIHCLGKWAELGQNSHTHKLPTQMMKKKYMILVTLQHVLEAIVTFQ